MRVRDETLRGQLLAFGGVAIVASALSLVAFHYQLHALSIGGRDLGFFMAEYERLFELPAWRELAVQPNGVNAFGFAGADGHPTLHHDIHLSPLKYALALVYAATGSWLAVQLALVATLFAALAYVLVRWQRARPGDALTLTAITALVLSPPFVRTTCHDLRPAVALGAFVVALAAALLSRAPSRHLAVLAMLGLFVREDAAVILALASAWLFVDGRRADARKLYLGVAAYVVLFHAIYFGVMPFAYEPRPLTMAVWAALLFHPLLASAPSRVASRLARAHERHRAWSILVLGLPFVFVWIEPVLGGRLVRSALARSFPAMLLACVASTYWLLGPDRARPRRWATALALASIVPALALSVRMIASLRSMADRHAGVWALAQRLPDETPVVTDFAHYQAFAGRDRLLVWEWLPASLEPTEAREFPASRDRLARVLTDLDGLVIVSDASFERLGAALRRSGAEPLEICRADSTLVIARSASSRTECPAL
jgi:hypothetical protein